MPQTTRLAIRPTSQERSLAAFMTRKAKVDELLARLVRASEDHFGADPERVLWGEAGSLAEVERHLQHAVDFIGA
jgi:hypothetical protein